MLVSVIIISKEEEKYIGKLLKSIKNQTYKDYEIIVADADSKDKTREIARKYGCKIIKGGLPSIARNRGAKIAKGDILLFLDADVILPEDFLKKNLEEFRKRNLVCATPIYKPISKKLIDKLFYLFYNTFARITQYFFPHAGGLCIFCRKETFEALKGFREDLQMCEDHNFVYRSSKLGKFRILHSIPILCDIRRLEKEGRWGLARKYFIIACHRIFKGEMFELPFDYTLHGGVNIRKCKR